MTIKELVESYSKGFSGTGNKQVLSVTLIDSRTAEILYSKMRAEGFLKLINPDLEVDEWSIAIGKPYHISSSEKRLGHKRTSIIIQVYANIMEDVPDYYTTEEWEQIIKRGEYKA